MALKNYMDEKTDTDFSHDEKRPENKENARPSAIALIFVEFLISNYYFFLPLFLVLVSGNILAY